jgi:hypothetical protein
MEASVVVNGGVTQSGVVENDEVFYSDQSKPEPEPKPDPEKECCGKTYTVILHFH